MKTILTIIKDQSRAQMYEHLARFAGAQIIHAEGALHALTQVERSNIDVVICEAHMDDMSGEEFRMVVHEEIKTSLVPVFILPDAEQLAGKASLEDAAPCGPELLRQVLQVIGVEPQHFPAPMNHDLRPQLQGDLDQFSLADFLNWVAEMGFHGHWMVGVQDAGGHERSAHLLMDAGNIVYAEFAGHVGKAALFALLRAIHQFPQTSFRFYKTDDQLRVRSADMQKSTSRLLMELAVDLDHLSAQHSHN